MCITLLQSSCCFHRDGRKPTVPRDRSISPSPFMSQTKNASAKPGTKPAPSTSSYHLQSSAASKPLQSGPTSSTKKSKSYKDHSNEGGQNLSAPQNKGPSGIKADGRSKFKAQPRRISPLASLRSDSTANSRTSSGGRAAPSSSSTDQAGPGMPSLAQFLDQSSYQLLNKQQHPQQQKQEQQPQQQQKQQQEEVKPTLARHQPPHSPFSASHITEYQPPQNLPPPPPRQIAQSSSSSADSDSSSGSSSSSSGSSSSDEENDNEVVRARGDIAIW